jgi:hypothetical protein
VDELLRTAGQGVREVSPGDEQDAPRPRREARCRPDRVRARRSASPLSRRHGNLAMLGPEPTPPQVCLSLRHGAIPCVGASLKPACRPSYSEVSCSGIEQAELRPSVESGIDSGALHRYEQLVPRGHGRVLADAEGDATVLHEPEHETLAAVANLAELLADLGRLDVELDQLV